LPNHLTCIGLGPVNGRFWEREDVYALSHLVRLYVLVPSPIVSAQTWRCISSNNPASLTSRLGATIDVEQNHVRFLGDLILNLWDCGGQDAFMDAYLSAQRSTIFQHVGVMIYVFDVESRETHKDLEYYRDCLEGLQQFSAEAAVFLLIHKMDLVRGDKNIVFDKKKAELLLATGDVSANVFGTSIHDESLYKVRRLLVDGRPIHQFMIGLVEHCAYADTKCCHLVKTSDNICRGV